MNVSATETSMINYLGPDMQTDRDPELNVIHKYGMEVSLGTSRYMVGKPDWSVNPYEQNTPMYPLEYEQGMDIRMRRSQFDRLCQDLDRFLELWEFLRDTPEAEAQFLKWRMWQRLKT